MSESKVFQNKTGASYPPALRNDGQVVEVVRELYSYERDVEVGRMFLVRNLQTGDEFDVFEDEITEEAE